MIKLGYVVLKEVIRVLNEEIRLYDLDRSQLGTQYTHQIIWS